MDRGSTHFYCDLFGFEGAGAEEQAGYDSAEAGNDEEEPELRECFAADEDGGAEAARGVNADAGDVDAEDVNGNQRDADAKAGEARRRGLLRGAEDHDNEDERGYELEDDGRCHVVTALVAGTPSVLAEAAGGDAVAAVDAADDNGEHSGGEDGSSELADPVADHIAGLHAAGGPYAQADGGVDVAAGDGADTVGSADEREAEGECDAEDSDFVAGHDCGAAAKEHQNEGAYEFCKIFFHTFSCVAVMFLSVFCGAQTIWSRAAGGRSGLGASMKLHGKRRKNP